jgi:LmbE family N-acetylglucosaminyl deacetylase
LVRIRRDEAASAGRVVGAEYVTWDNPDGALQVTLDLRHQIIREIRTFKPDLVLTHRTNDYHPDHRAVGQSVQDASYMVTVPLVCPDVPILEKDPIVAYMIDLFTKPYPHQGDVVLDVTDQIDTIVDMMACHKSQFLDFLPFNAGIADQVPQDEAAQKPWLREWFKRIAAPRVRRFRDQLVRAYGDDRAAKAEAVEAYEISEYAGTFDDSLRDRLFPRSANS